MKISENGRVWPFCIQLSKNLKLNVIKNQSTLFLQFMCLQKQQLSLFSKFFEQSNFPTIRMSCPEINIFCPVKIRKDGPSPLSDYISETNRTIISHNSDQRV